MDTEALLCDCKLKWFREWMDSSGVSIENVHAKCQYPEKLKGRLLLSVRVEELICGNPFIKIDKNSTNSLLSVADSPIAHLTNPPPPLITTLLGSNISISCSGHGAPPLQLIWKFRQNDSSTQLTNSSKYQLLLTNNNSLISGELHIINATLSDASLYQCIIQNSYSTAYSDPILVKVHRLPTFKTKPRDVFALVGQNALLECSADGIPEPEITWDKDKKQSFPAAMERRLHIRDQEDGLYFLNVSTRDEGNYRCRASNDAGVIEQTARLRVFGNLFD
jgi:hypothetical protein